MKNISTPIQIPCENGGGWEFEYFPDHFRGEDGRYFVSTSDIAYLLENWPDRENLPDGYPSEETDIYEYLDELINGGTLNLDSIPGCMGLKEYECYAIIAMDRLEVAVTEFKRADRKMSFDWNEECILSSMKFVLESMDLLCKAEGLKSSEDLSEKEKKGMHEKEIELRKSIRSSMGRTAAQKRHSLDPKQQAKAEVFDCWKRWQENPSEYKSKSAFARAMLDKYEALESQKVITDRWCPEWELERSQGTTQPA